MLGVRPNAWIEFDYTLTDERGEPLNLEEVEYCEGAVHYVHGYGMLPPGLEAALIGMNVDEKRDVFLSAEEGFGEYAPDLVFLIDQEELPASIEKIQMGDALMAEDQKGEKLELRIMEVHPTHLVVNANHPLAGQALRYHITLRAIRPATEDEIVQAAQFFDEMEDYLKNDSGKSPTEAPHYSLLSIRLKKDRNEPH
ncbi:FKBP-type peptidyl-prolyl cis-trans isomerase [Pajaroellobacter abortibovis]|uniref:Peptidyl-prolyl cis-trans isomerase n=1 Tax=Pajaroellobacter abortibovis TaxID=1882918 RepID=A0A1L6MVZ8_9BACT|nr:FKBP-type peptidyl-prolyl cis-trans isomerase [Pajaroellobacter abortibovis]APR99691.1 hypothetical protein BCY86_02630 [Pajaroellobacter abortibovis]